MKKIYKKLKYPNIEKGKYMISIYGDVIRVSDGKLMKPWSHKGSGYLQFTLVDKDGNNIMVSQHRLVAYTFKLFKKQGMNVVNHIDGVKSNNYVENLEWVDHSENNRHAYRTGLMKSGEDHHFSSHSNSFIISICELLEKGLSTNEILNKLKLENIRSNRDLILRIKRRERWIHISKDYNFPETKRIGKNRDEESIHEICQLLEKGLSTGEILITLGLERCRRNTDIIARIRRKERWTSISKLYNI